MSRNQRRLAKKQGAIFLDYGRIAQSDVTDGLAVDCYKCGETHKASGIVRVEDRKRFTAFPLCEECLASDSRKDDVVRKFLNAPTLTIREGGEATAEQITALADKHDSREH